MNKSIITTSLLFLSGISNAQESSVSNNTESVILTTQEDIARTLREPCADMEGVKLLNCRIKEPNTSGWRTGDTDIRKKVAQSRSRFNFFIANGLGLPMSVVNQPAEFNRSTPGTPIIERQSLRMNFLPEGVQTSIGLQRLSIKYTIPF